MVSDSDDHDGLGDNVDDDDDDTDMLGVAGPTTCPPPTHGQ